MEELGAETAVVTLSVLLVAILLPIFVVAMEVDNIVLPVTLVAALVEIEVDPMLAVLLASDALVPAEVLEEDTVTSVPVLVMSVAATVDDAEGFVTVVSMAVVVVGVVGTGADDTPVSVLALPLEAVVLIVVVAAVVVVAMEEPSDKVVAALSVLEMMEVGFAAVVKTSDVVVCLVGLFGVVVSVCDVEEEDVALTLETRVTGIIVVEVSEAAVAVPVVTFSVDVVPVDLLLDSDDVVA